MGELHLEVIVDRLMREFKVTANVGKPQVAYRETIGQEATATGSSIRPNTAGKGQFAECVLKVTPGETNSGLEITNAAHKSDIPKEFIPAVREGIENAYQSGPLLGYPLVDVRVDIVGGAFDDNDSSEVAFNVASAMAFRQACEDGAPKMLEPVMEVEIVVPEDNMGDVIGHVNSKGAARFATWRLGQRASVLSLQSCPWPACSDTPRNCVQRPKDEEHIRCNFRITHPFQTKCGAGCSVNNFLASE